MMLIFVLSFLLALNSVSAQYGNSTVTCLEYSADNTDYATAAYCTCSFTLCPGQVATVSGCAACSNDYNQYISVYNEYNYLVASNDGTGSSCAPCAEIKNILPNAFYCQTFTINEGCTANNACNGQMVVNIVSSNIETSSSSFRKARMLSSDPKLLVHSLGKASVTHFKKMTGMVAQDASSVTPMSTSYPSCTYTFDLGALGALLGAGIVIAIVISAICGCACVSALCFFICLPCIAPCMVVANQQQKQKQQEQQMVQQHNALHQQHPQGVVVMQGQPVVVQGNPVGIVPAAVQNTPAVQKAPENGTQINAIPTPDYEADYQK